MDRGTTSATGDFAGRGVTQRARAASQDVHGQGSSSSSSSVSVPTSYWQYLNRPTPAHDRVQLYEQQKLEAQTSRNRSHSTSAGSYASGNFVGYVDPANQLTAYNKFVANKPFADLKPGKINQNMENGDYAQLKLKEDTMFVPPQSMYMAPHPLSDTRTNFSDNDAVDMKRVMALRKLGGCVIPTSKSLTDVPIAPDASVAKEFNSVQQLHKVRNKQVRPIKSPYEKFSGTMTLSQQAIGWAQDEAKDPSKGYEVKYKGPDAGIKDSFVTQYYHNMKMTNMEAILRYAK